VQAQVVSVTQVNEYLRLLVESDSFLANIWVEGDVTNLSRPGKGHIYFTLSDGNSSLRAMVWRNNAARIQHAITEGARIVAGGRISVYSASGQCQLYVDYADISGAGVQALALARLRAQLEADGLFDAVRKRPLPDFPRTIGVVTSSTGAVIHDIQTVLRRRFPFARLLVSPAQVQGAGAVDSLIAALDLLVKDRQADVIIIARGGGSAEDLSAFNDERLARAVYAAPIPVVSAIGHETDVCILDDVADMRAPTPSAAAELISPDIADFAFSLIDARERLGHLLRSAVGQRQSDLIQAEQRLDRANPSTTLKQHRALLAEQLLRLSSGAQRHLRAAQADCRLTSVKLQGAGVRVVDLQRIDLAGTRSRLSDPVRTALLAGQAGLNHDRQRLGSASRAYLAASSADLQILGAGLSRLNPTAVLDRGFAVVSLNGQTVSSIGHVRPDDRIRALVRDGTISASVTETARR
jgi:exodeoxyribonuclease VII large subunit